MLIGVYGVFAVGKTTFFKDNMDDLADMVVDGRSNLVVVLADLADEYHFDKVNNEWYINHHKPIYKGKRDEKMNHLEAMISDRKTVWIVESARYFSGIHEDVCFYKEQAGGGVRFIMPYCSPATAKQFLIDRCDKCNKTFRAEYWDDKRLAYECKDRYVNMVGRYYQPAGIRCHTFEVSYSRKEWAGVLPILRKWVATEEEGWYA